ncbi:hypothetical protein MRX96_038819 [Rhipicephalus microplus]
MATPSPKSLAIALVVAAVMLVQLAFVGRHRMFSQLAQCDCHTSDYQESTEAKMPSVTDDLDERLRRINTYCEKYVDVLQEYERWDDSLIKSSVSCAGGPRSLYLVDNRRFAFCAVPKAATSSIKALILLAQNASAKFEQSRPKLSAVKHLYKGGFSGRGPNGTYTFAEFVKIILNMPVQKWDSHWAPYTTRCRPCTMRYNLIVKVETLDRDLEFLLPIIGLAGWSFPKMNAKETYNRTDEGSKEYFAELTRQQVLQLHAIYMYDFEFFGYTLKDYATPVL